MKKEKEWIEVTSTLDWCKMTGAIKSIERPYRKNEGDKSFDYFSSLRKAQEFVRGFYHA